MLDYHKVSYFFDLFKQKSDLQFRSAYFSFTSNAESLDSCKNKLDSLENEIKSTVSDCLLVGISIVIPHQNKLDEISHKLDSYEFKQILLALKEKNGDIYDLIIQRNKIINDNYKNRDTIAKLLFFISKLAKIERYLLFDVIKTGSIEEAFQITCHHDLACRFLRRLGISAISSNGFLKTGSHDAIEIPVALNSKLLWLPNDHAKRFLEIQSQLQILSAKMQVKMVQSGSDPLLEKEYLQILNEYDSLLTYIKEEDNVLLSLC